VRSDGSASKGGVPACPVWRRNSDDAVPVGVLAAAFANGGTLYYLQYPEAGQEISAFVPVSSVN